MEEFMNNHCNGSATLLRKRKAVYNLQCLGGLGWISQSFQDNMLAQALQGNDFLIF